MIIDYLNILRTLVPAEHHAPLIVDAYRIPSIHLTWLPGPRNGTVTIALMVMAQILLRHKTDPRTIQTQYTTSPNTGNERITPSCINTNRNSKVENPLRRG